MPFIFIANLETRMASSYRDHITRLLALIRLASGHDAIDHAFVVPQVYFIGGTGHDGGDKVIERVVKQVTFMAQTFPFELGRFEQVHGLKFLHGRARLYEYGNC